jgi:hypothetical protein
MFSLHVNKNLTARKCTLFHIIIYFCPEDFIPLHLKITLHL